MTLIEFKVQNNTSWWAFLVELIMPRFNTRRRPLRLADQCR
jgi:hypothetical protein